MKISISNTAVVVIVAGFLCMAGNTQAQHNRIPADTGKVYKLDELIISASRFEESPSSVGRNVTIISRSEIDRSVYTSVAGILAEQQSLHVVGDRQTPGSNQTAFLRNTNSNHYVVMIDGVRMSDPSTNNNGVDLSELSLAGVQRIEIVRGSHSTLYGSSAIGGVINIITQKAGSPGVNADLNTQHGLLGTDTYSTSNNASANVTLDSGFYLNLSAFQQYTPGLDATVDTVSGQDAFNPGDRDRFDKLDLMGKLGYHTSTIDVYGSYRRVAQASGADQGAYTDDDNAKLDFNRDLFSYGGSYALSGPLSVNLSGAWSELGRDFVNDSSVVDAQGNYDGTYTETNGEGTLWKNELTAAFDGDHIRTLVGAGLSQQTMTSRNYVFSRSSFGNFEQTTDLDSLNLKETISSVFVHTDLNGSLLGDDLDNLSLVLGSRMVSHNQFGTHLTYEINPQVQVTPSALVYGAVTTGFNAPSLYQLHSPSQGFGAYTSRGNETLDPETSVSYELGWKQSYNGMIQLNISLFKTQVRDVIEYVYLWNGDSDVANLGFDDYRGDTYINMAKQDINGIELGVNIQAIPKVNIKGNLTYTHSVLRFSPRDIDESYTGVHHVQVFESGVFVSEEAKVDGLTRRPSTSANVNVNYNPLSRLSLNVTSRFVGDRDDVFYSAGLGPYGALDRSKVNGYNLTDLGVRYRFNSNVALGIQIENVFDTNYVDINGYRTQGRGAFMKASFKI